MNKKGKDDKNDASSVPALNKDPNNDKTPLVTVLNEQQREKKI